MNEMAFMVIRTDQVCASVRKLC